MTLFYILHVRNYEGPDTLPYRLGDKLPYHNFIDAGRRHEAPGSETKNFITHDTADSMSFMFATISLVP